jgi:hypothetical protein
MFKSWLDAGGERNLVEASIKDWLAYGDNKASPGNFRDVHKSINNYQKQPNKISIIS